MLSNIQWRLLLTPLLPTGVFRWDVLCYFLLRFILGHSVKDILSCSLRRLSTLKPPDTAGLCQRDKSRVKVMLVKKKKKKKDEWKITWKVFTDLLEFFKREKQILICIMYYVLLLAYAVMTGWKAWCILHPALFEAVRILSCDLNSDTVKTVQVCNSLAFKANGLIVFTDQCLRLEAALRGKLRLHCFLFGACWLTVLQQCW